MAKRNSDNRSLPNPLMHQDGTGSGAPHHAHKGADAQGVKTRSRPRAIHGSLLCVALLTTVAGCGGDDSSDSGNLPPSAGLPASTPQGQRVGVPTKALIGTNGGRLVSPDGRLSITVPAGALAQDTELAIERITNTAMGGSDGAYRLTPHGAIFATPVTITFGYTDAEVAGTLPELMKFAFQRDDGFWQVIDSALHDSEARTLSVTTTHFSDWISVPEMLLTPVEAVVKVGESVSLKVLDCIGQMPDGQPLSAVIPNCHPMTEEGYLLAGGQGWSVNGVAGGSGSVGTLANAEGTTTNTYTAPGVKPTPNTVAVSVGFNSGLSSPAMLISNITVVDDGRSYTGTLTYARSPMIEATANVTWELFEELPDVRSYLATGTITGVLRSEGCANQPFSLPIAPGDAGDPLSWIVVFNDIASAPFTNSHHFGIQPAPEATITLTCDGTSYEVPASVVAMGAGATCPSGNLGRVYHSDTRRLTGEWNCMDLAAQWDFVLQ